MKNINLTKKDRNLILIMFVPYILNIFVTYFYYHEYKADIYIFYEHSRYLDNIFYDIHKLLVTSLMTFIISKMQKVAMPFFLISILDWILYFLFYKQSASLIEIPILVILIIICISRKR